MSMITVLTHADFEGPVRIATWAEGKGAGMRIVNLWAGEPVPTAEATDALVLMGGPMSVNDEADFPWLATEKALVRAMVAAEKPVLGVCLGAQLIASALGGRVTRNPAGREIGVWPIRATGDDPFFPILDGLPVFHWHGERCELPPGATPLASSVACETQVFRIGRRCLALQCHLETDTEAAELMLARCAGDLEGGGPHTQDGATIRAGVREAEAPMRAALDRLLDAWLA